MEDDSSEGTYFSCLEEVLRKEITYYVVHLCHDCAFATSESYSTFGHVGEVENPSLRLNDIKPLNLKELWDGATKAEFHELVDLRAFVFGIKVPRGSNVVCARWVFAWNVDKPGYLCHRAKSKD